MAEQPIEARARPLFSARDGSSRLAIFLAVILPMALLIDPVMPAGDLDPSWIFAVERAFQNGLVFGRDFVFTFGPLAFLSTHLFHPSTFAFTLIADLALALLVVAPLALSRRPLVLLLYAALLLVAPVRHDALVAAALLSFLMMGARQIGIWQIAVAALLFAPLALTKFSYFPLILLLLLLMDGGHLVARKAIPRLVPAFLAGFLVLLLTLGQPWSALPDLFANTAQIAGGFSAAMQASLSLSLPLFLIVIALGNAGLAWRMWGGVAVGRIGLVPALMVAAGVAWLSFFAFKQGYVRQDLEHMVIGWQFVALAVPISAAFLDSLAPLRKRDQRALVAIAGVATIIVTGSNYALSRSTTPDASPAAFLVERALVPIERPVRALGWLTPGRWADAAAQRVAAEQALRRAFPESVQGGVDAVPHELSPLLASGLDYRPRPVPQSYSAYTPGLQQLDGAFLNDPARAPDTLIVRGGIDIDQRLPALALGPNLPVVARWYDVAGADPLGLILRRRTEPRAAQSEDFPERRFQLGEWVALPPSDGRLLMVAIDLPPSPYGRARNLVYRSPILSITLRDGQGEERSFRFVPPMAKQGVLLSPAAENAEPDNLPAMAALLSPGALDDALREITAFRISGGGDAALAFGEGRATPRAIALSPGRGEWTLP